MRAGCGDRKRRPLACGSGLPLRCSVSWPAQNSLHSLRSVPLRQLRESVYEARCARGHEPCASRRLLLTPQPARTPLRSTVAVLRREPAPTVDLAAGGTRWGCIGSAEAHSVRGSERQRASWTDSRSLFEHRERSERSEFGRGHEREHWRALEAFRAEGANAELPAGTARRDAPTSNRNERPLRADTRQTSRTR